MDVVVVVRAVAQTMIDVPCCMRVQSVSSPDSDTEDQRGNHQRTETAFFDDHLPTLTISPLGPLAST